MLGTPPLFVTERTSIAEPVPDTVGSWAATIDPLLSPSVWFAGTGVLKSEGSTLAALPATNTLPGGQLEPAAGFVIQSMSEPRYLALGDAESNTFTPISRNSLVSPSFG